MKQTQRNNKWLEGSKEDTTKRKYTTNEVSSANPSAKENWRVWWRSNEGPALKASVHKSFDDDQASTSNNFKLFLFSQIKKRKSKINKVP